MLPPPRPVGARFVPPRNWLVVTPKALVFRLFGFMLNAFVPAPNLLVPALNWLAGLLRLGVSWF